MSRYTHFKQVRISYGDIPPQSFISEVNKFFRDHQPLSGFNAEMVWERRPEAEADLEERQST